MTSLVSDYLNLNQTNGIIDLFQVDTSPAGGGMVYLTNQPTASGTLTFNSLSYNCIPVAMSKASMNTSGTLPQPQLSVAVTSNPLLRATIAAYGDLVGCKVTKFSTLTKYLDATNTTRINILDWSQDLSQATWVKTATTVTSNAIAAPDGTLTADLVLDTAVNAQHFITKNATVATVLGDLLNVSCYIKSGGAAYALIYISSSGTSGLGGGIVIDLSTGLISATNNGTFITNQVSTPAGDGWHRVSFSCRASGTTSVARVYLIATNSGSAPAYLGDGTKGAYIWGYQVERVTQSTIDAAGLTTSNSTIAQNTALATDPIGTNTADILADTAVNSTHSAFRTVAGFLEGQTVYYTVHCKAGSTITNVMVRFLASTALATTGYADINLSTGAVTTHTGLVEAPVVWALTNGWYRIRIGVTCTANGSLSPALFLLNTTTQNTYLGTGAGIYIWNGQLTWDEHLRDYQYTTTTHAPYADPTAISPVETYYISQLVDFGPETVTWKLCTPLDRPNLLIPRLQYLKDAVGDHVYAPGLNRVMG